MAKKFTLFVVILTVLALCVVLVACGDPANSTDPTQTTTQPKDNTDPNSTPEVTDPITPPDNTPKDTDAPPVPLLPNEQLLEDLIMEATWVTAHMEYQYTTRTDGQGVEHPCFYVTIKAEGNNFPYVTEEEVVGENEQYAGYVGVPGLQLTKGLYALVRDLEDEATEDYTKYNCTYYDTAQWYETWFGCDFVPEDGHSYDIVWVIESGPVGAKEPNSVHYIWTMDIPWTYIAPEIPVSNKMPEEQFNALIAGKTQLIEHIATTVDAQGNLSFAFKSDGDPFTNEEGGIPGVSMTGMGLLYIDGEEKQIVSGSYTTVEHYIINFQIADFTPEDGKTYEIIFTITSNDDGNGYCKDPDGYFVVVTVTYTAPATGV